MNTMKKLKDLRVLRVIVLFVRAVGSFQRMRREYQNLCRYDALKKRPRWLGS
jgi:tryptophan-rich sensory protein